MPRLFVCTDPASFDSVLAELEAAGWCRRPSFEVGPTPWHHGRSTTVCSGEIDGAADITVAAELLTRGISVVALVSRPTLAADLFEQGGRLAGAEWYGSGHPPPSTGLDSTQIGLLLSVREGLGVADAARRHHLSQRTAARRLAEARETLGCRTNGEAAARLGARIDALRVPS